MIINSPRSQSADGVAFLTLDLAVRGIIPRSASVECLIEETVEVREGVERLVEEARERHVVNRRVASRLVVSAFVFFCVFVSDAKASFTPLYIPTDIGQQIFQRKFTILP